MARITKMFVPDSMQVQKELKIPMVITKKIEDGVEVYHGFVPGLTKEDCISIEMAACKKLLREDTDKIIDSYLKNQKEFPFFPTKEEIIEDFDNVCQITFITL